MALRFLNLEISELCLGKPQVTWVAANATIADALRALKTSGNTHVSVWVCGGDGVSNNRSCVCVGKFCVADLILFLCREENLGDPFKAFEAPVYDILPKGSPIVRHLEPNCSLLEAMDYILEGTQNLVIPIQNHHLTNSRKKLHSRQLSSHCHQYCWLAQEDIIRFLLNAVGAFFPIPTSTIDSLNIINHEIMTIHHDTPVSSALSHFHRALTEQTSVAVIDEDNRLIGEISPLTLACCDETAAGAIMAEISAIDFMTYTDCGGPPEELVQLVKMRLEERNLGAMVEFVDEFFNSSTSSSSSSSCSSDDDSVLGKNGGSGRVGFGSGRNCFNRRYDTIVCSPRSTLVAVMIKALAHRVTYVWVVEEDHTLVGVVTFAGILKVLHSFACDMPSEMDKSLK